MAVFKFTNSNMTKDLVDDKGKVISYREINVIAPTENAARIKAYRPKIDGELKMLSKDWVLTSVHDHTVDQ